MRISSCSCVCSLVPRSEETGQGLFSSVPRLRRNRVSSLPGLQLQHIVQIVKVSALALSGLFVLPLFLGGRTQAMSRGCMQQRPLRALQFQMVSFLPSFLGCAVIPQKIRFRSCSDPCLIVKKDILCLLCFFYDSVDC